MGKWLEAAQRRRAEIDQERDGLNSRIAELERLKERLETSLSMTQWAELESGDTVNVDDEVRYMFKTYRCIKAHTKSLTRRPTNTEYWEEMTE